MDIYSGFVWHALFGGSALLVYSSSGFCHSVIIFSISLRLGLGVGRSVGWFGSVFIIGFNIFFFTRSLFCLSLMGVSLLWLAWGVNFLHFFGAFLIYQIDSSTALKRLFLWHCFWSMRDGVSLLSPFMFRRERRLGVV